MRKLNCNYLYIIQSTQKLLTMSANECIIVKAYCGVLSGVRYAYEVYSEKKENSRAGCNNRGACRACGGVDVGLFG